MIANPSTIARLNLIERCSESVPRPQQSCQLELGHNPRFANRAKRASFWPAVVALGASVFTPIVVSAKCFEGGDHVYPQPSRLMPLPVNGRIVLTRSWLLRVDSAKTNLEALELRSETDRVPLRVVETNRGVGEVQFVLSPVRRLRAETQYALWKRAKDGSEGPALGARGGFEWTTGPGPDNVKPRWRSRPTVGARRYTKYGCGPEILVEVKVAVRDVSSDLPSLVGEDAAVLVRAELHPSDGGSPLRYLLDPSRGVIEIGHGMCGGAFSLEPNQPYSVTLTAVDAAGNETPAPGRPLEIVGPAPELAKRK